MMKIIAVFGALFVVAALAGDPITVDPTANQESGGLDLSGTDLTTSFCEKKNAECKGANIADSGKFAPTPRQCLIRCAKDKKCLSAFFSKDKKCYLRSNRCELGQLSRNDGGLDLYRLKKKESCSKERPAFVASTVEFSNSFCMVWGKKCPGQDLYPKPQNIDSAEKCMIKCAKLSTCGSVDYTDGKCSPKEMVCADSELVDDKNYRNYVRLVKGVDQCGPGRVEPSDTKPSVVPTEPAKPKPVPVPAPPKYCVRPYFDCVWHDTQFIPFVFSLERCQEFCTASDSCKSIHHGSLGGCWLKKHVCSNLELTPSAGTDAVKVDGNASCDKFHPKNTYCVRENKNCLGHDLELIMFVPSRERCQMYCDFDERCRSIHWEYITHGCWLKNHVCHGFLSPIYDLFGSDAVKTGTAKNDHC